MSIWIHSEKSRELEHVDWIGICVFCKAPLRGLASDLAKDVELHTNVNVSVCDQCGWWTAKKIYTSTHGVHRIRSTRTHGAAASLREMDLTDISLPIGEVRDYLMARFDSINLINPRLFEETVGSIFRDLGWNVMVTAYSGDDGIDAFLEKGGQTVGVQVKRYRSKIQVEQIRSLAGALLLNGLTKGIFVTTSSFQSGAQRTVDRLVSKGYAIELMDSARLFDALKIAQREKYRLGRDFPWELLKDMELIGADSWDPWRDTKTRLDTKTWKWIQIEGRRF
jgi:restriction system protein